MSKVLKLIRHDQETIRILLDNIDLSAIQGECKELTEILKKYTELKNLAEVKKFQNNFFKLFYLAKNLNVTETFTKEHLFDIGITILILDQYYKSIEGDKESIKLLEDVYDQNIQEISRTEKKLKAEKKETDKYKKSKNLTTKTRFHAIDLVTKNLTEMKLFEKDNFGDYQPFKKELVELKGNGKTKEKLIIGVEIFDEGEVKINAPVTKDEISLMNDLYSIYESNLNTALSKGDRVAFSAYQLYYTIYGTKPKADETYEELFRKLRRLSSIRTKVTYAEKGIRIESYLLPLDFVEYSKMTGDKGQGAVFIREPAILEYAKHRKQFIKVDYETLRISRLSSNGRVLRDYLLERILSKGNMGANEYTEWKIKIRMEKIYENFPSEDSNPSRSKIMAESTAKKILDHFQKQELIKSYKVTESGFLIEKHKKI